ncbi:MAG: cytochrome c oxidase accessory protein CcoG [Planctomycetota bacterium]
MSTKTNALPLLNAPEHVLSTLESDGTRRWLRPRLATGAWWNRRRITAYCLIVIFVSIPHLRIGGKPLVLLDIAARKFTLFGHTFLPTDTLLLALAIVGLLVAIVLATTLTGRVWCGWGCPQTVYMEFLFRPIDRFFEGTSGRGGKPKRIVTGALAVARYAIYVVLCMALAHTFLAYFVGTERLAQWIRTPPWQHPTAFLVMGGTTALMLFDFLIFREQMCLIACPYGRFQSVMLDRNSLIVSYDPGRGEPRRHGRRHEGDGLGDCIDCKQCVTVCPTGIDIRDGLQMECINCTQCMDACDQVMTRLGKPKGLIRYSSQEALDGKPLRLLRMRTILYPLLLTGIAVAFGAVLSTKYAFDAKVMRGTGNPFNRTADRMIVNQFRMRLSNRTNGPRQYQFRVLDPSNAVLDSDKDGRLTLDEGGSELFPISIRVPTSTFGPGGSATGQIQIIDDIGNERTLPLKLLGPR